LDDRATVIIGVGEASERIDAANWRALSPADLAVEAARAALADARASRDLAGEIDVIAAIRQFEVSTPRAMAPFGRADNFPRAVAAGLGAAPRRAILEPVGGQGPQHLVNEFAKAIAAGEDPLVLLCGAEAISTVRKLMSAGETRDWSQTLGGQLEDRGLGDPLLSPELTRHGGRTPIVVYSLFENARRARLGLDRAAYAAAMGALFAPFTRIAATHPHAMSREVYDAAALATATPGNRLVSDPYPRRLVARDQANQGAAVLMTSAARARALGVPPERWVFLHGGADLRDRLPLERPDLSQAPGARQAARAALERAGLHANQVDLFDLYSCFPIAVFNLMEGLGLALDDPRPLTLTGGLPFFGGAGNNYSMHALAAMVRGLREAPDAFGLVSANGGFLSKTSVGVYSARPASAQAFDDDPAQRAIDSAQAPALDLSDGPATVVTYAIDYAGPAPAAIVVGARASGARVVAMTDPDDPTLAEAMIAAEPLGARVETRQNAEGRAVIRAFEPA
jgi:acetyl-CoA C-acetyltransferase